MVVRVLVGEEAVCGRCRLFHRRRASVEVGPGNHGGRGEVEVEVEEVVSMVVAILSKFAPERRGPWVVQHWMSTTLSGLCLPARFSGGGWYLWRWKRKKDQSDDSPDDRLKDERVRVRGESQPSLFYCLCLNWWIVSCQGQ